MQNKNRKSGWLIKNSWCRMEYYLWQARQDYIFAGTKIVKSNLPIGDSAT